MAIENVNVAKLKNALYNCKETIDYSKILNLITKASESSLWIGESKTAFLEELRKQAFTRYKNLKDVLDNYLDITQFMEQYLNYQTSVQNNEEQYQDLSYKLSNTNSYDEKIKIQSEMQQIRNAININYELMIDVDEKIKNSI